MRRLACRQVQTQPREGGRGYLVALFEMSERPSPSRQSRLAQWSKHTGCVRGCTHARKRNAGEQERTRTGRRKYNIDRRIGKKRGGVRYPDFPIKYRAQKSAPVCGLNKVESRPPRTKDPMTQPKGTKKRCHDAKTKRKEHLDALHFSISAQPCVLDSLAPRGHATLRDATAQPPHGRYDSAQWGGAYHHSADRRGSRT